MNIHEENVRLKREVEKANIFKNMIRQLIADTLGITEFSKKQTMYGVLMNALNGFPKLKNPIKIHVHVNSDVIPERQICSFDGTINEGETLTVHLHNAPDECTICANGHCHAPNITLVRIEDDKFYLVLENFIPFGVAADVKALPHHGEINHAREGENFQNLGEVA